MHKTLYFLLSILILHFTPSAFSLVLQEDFEYTFDDYRTVDFSFAYAPSFAINKLIIDKDFSERHVTAIQFDTSFYATKHFTLGWQFNFYEPHVYDNQRFYPINMGFISRFFIWNHEIVNGFLELGTRGWSVGSNYQFWQDRNSDLWFTDFDIVAGAGINFILTKRLQLGFKLNHNETFALKNGRLTQFFFHLLFKQQFER